MRAPIDYIVVGFEGNKFHGEVLAELTEAVQKGIIAVLDISIIIKDENGDITAVKFTDSTDPIASRLLPNGPEQNLIDKDDIEEIGDLLENNTAAGLLIIEQLWAKGLKQALINAQGVLLAEGRIHPDAYAELDKVGDR